MFLSDFHFVSFLPSHWAYVLKQQVKTFDREIFLASRRMFTVGEYNRLKNTGGKRVVGVDVLCRRFNSYLCRQFSPSVGEQFPQDIEGCVGWNMYHPVEDVGKVFEGVNVMKPTGTGQRK